VVTYTIRQAEIVIVDLNPRESGAVKCEKANRSRRLAMEATIQL
jgi:hypothetical protein